MRCHGLGVFLLTDSEKWFCTHLKVRNELGVELGKANEFCDIADKFRSWPCLEETVLGLRRTITIFAHINANKFEPCWEEEAFAEVQQKILCLADLQLASHVSESLTDMFGPTHNITHDDFCIGILVDGNTLFLGFVLPDAVNIMDEINEGCWPICWSKGHYSVGPLDHIHPLKSELFLTQFCNSQLMIPHQRVKHPHPHPVSKLVEDHRITSWDGVCNQESYPIQGNVFYAETPDKVLSVVDCFLVGLRSE